MKRTISIIMATIIVLTTLFSVGIVTTSAAVLKAPVITKTESVANGIMLSWSKVAGAARYRIFVKSGNHWKSLGDTYGTTWTDKTAKAGKAYTYTVRCVSANGRKFTSYYNRKGFTVKNLAIPRINKIEGVSNGTKLSWNKVYGADRYRVFVKVRGKWKALANTSATSYTNTNVADGNSYTYTVRCVSKNGKAYTSYFNTTGYTAIYNSTPQITDISSTRSGLQLTWQKKNHASLYRVFSKTGSGWKKIADTTENQYTDTNVIDDNSYTYTVRCVSHNRKYYSSDYAKDGFDAIYTKPDDSDELPFVPAITSTSVNGNILYFNWENLSGVFAYAVYYKNGTAWQLLDGEIGSTSFAFPFTNAGDYTFAVIACDPADDKPHVAPEKAQFTVTIKYVVDQEAYSYEKPITTQEAYCCCNKCGADVTGDENGYASKHGSEYSDWTEREYHSIIENCNGGWHTDYRTVITGYETINVPEKGHYVVEKKIDFIPSITKIELTENSIRFTWKKLNGVFAYAVYYKHGTAWQLLDGEIGSTSFAFPFTNAGDYTFAVIACDPSDDKPHVEPEKAQFTVTIKYVVDQEAYSYEKPITEQVAYACCNKCGEDVTGHVKDHPDKIDEWYDKYIVYHDTKKPSLPTLIKETFAIEWNTIQAHFLLDGCSTAYHNAYKTVITGYETVNVPEKGHFEIA